MHLIFHSCFNRSHGGGRRCSRENCNKLAVPCGKISNWCVRQSVQNYYRFTHLTFSIQSRKQQVPTIHLFLCLWMLIGHTRHIPPFLFLVTAWVKFVEGGITTPRNIVGYFYFRRSKLSPSFSGSFSGWLLSPPFLLSLLSSFKSHSKNTSLICEVIYLYASTSLKMCTRTTITGIFFRIGFD